MNDYARRMMYDRMRMPRGEEMMRHRGEEGGNKYFIYRDGRNSADSRGRRDYADMRDGRNPYGSRGGYVVSSKRDRAMDYADYRGDMRGDYAYDSRSDYESDSRDYARGRRDYGSEYGDREYDRAYSSPDHRYDGMDSEYDRQYDYDYADGASKLTKKDIKKWEKHLENADGTMGKKYTKEQIMPIANQLGIKFNDFNEEELTMAVNMLYSDYCKVLGGDMMMYVKLAKAFLEDDDFDGKGSEKLMLYYRCIVEE